VCVCVLFTFLMTALLGIIGNYIGVLTRFVLLEWLLFVENVFRSELVSGA